MQTVCLQAYEVWKFLPITCTVCSFITFFTCLGINYLAAYAGNRSRGPCSLGLCAHYALLYHLHALRAYEVESIGMQ